MLKCLRSKSRLWNVKWARMRYPAPRVMPTGNLFRKSRAIRQLLREISTQHLELSLICVTADTRVVLSCN